MIYCSALGNPAPQFKWSRKDGRRLDWTLSQLANGSRGIYIQSANVSRGRFIQLANGNLKVEPIRREDSGSYTCTIKQSRGYDSVSEKSQSITVRVIGKVRKNKNNNQKKQKQKRKQKDSGKGINALISLCCFKCGKCRGLSKKKRQKKRYEDRKD